jgi:hypothetical protein
MIVFRLRAIPIMSSRIVFSLAEAGPLLIKVALPMRGAAPRRHCE